MSEQASTSPPTPQPANSRPPSTRSCPTPNTAWPPGTLLQPPPHSATAGTPPTSSNTYPVRPATQRCDRQDPDSDHTRTRQLESLVTARDTRISPPSRCSLMRQTVGSPAVRPGPGDV